MKTTIGLPISNDLLDPNVVRVENLDRMVKHVMEETSSLLKSLNQMCCLLACEDTTQDTKQLVVKTGVLPKLVQFLSRDNHSDLQLAAVKVLTRVSFVGVIIMGAIPLVRLLSSPHTEIPLIAALALGNIAGESHHSRDLVLRAGAMHPLLKLLNNHQTIDVKSVRIYVWTLHKLCHDKPKPDFSLVSPALPVLKKLLYHSDEEVVAGACWGLGYLSDGPTHMQAIIIALEDTGVRRLVELLNHPSTSLQSSALRAVGYIAIGSISQTQLISVNNALPCLLDLFVNHSFSELKELLGSLRSNRALYDQYYGKVITVPCKISDGGKPGDKFFNIVKANRYDGSNKDKKYEFFLAGKFSGQKQSDGELACRVASSVIEPYFGKHTAGDIRKIWREDKERVNRLVNQSSSAFIHDFSSISQFQMKLMLSADEFYAKLAQVPRDSTSWMEDISNPPLLVLRKV